MPDRGNVINGLEWVLNDIEENGHYQISYYAGEIRKAIALLKEQETVVRCNDCRFGEPTMNGRGDDCIKCNNDDLLLDGDLHFPDWYCADGERRDDDD